MGDSYRAAARMTIRFQAELCDRYSALGRTGVFRGAGADAYTILPYGPCRRSSVLVIFLAMCVAVINDPFSSVLLALKVNMRLHM